MDSDIVLTGALPATILAKYVLGVLPNNYFQVLATDPMLTYFGTTGRKLFAGQAAKFDTWFNLEAGYTNSDKTAHVFLNGKLIGTASEVFDDTTFLIIPFHLL